MAKWNIKAKRIWREFRANLITQLLAWLGGSAMITSIGKAIAASVHRDSVDWTFLALLFIVGVCLVLFALWKTPPGIREQQLQEALTQARQETEFQVSAMLEAYTQSHPASIPQLQPLPLERDGPQPDPLLVRLSPLQKDALLLSERLLSFIEAQGSPPQPKYTREKIRNMSLEESRRLIEAENGDYAFACEYYFGTNFDKGKCETPEQLAALMLARFMLMDPWYEKVRAGYELEFRQEVEKMHNRFVLVDLSSEILNVPIQGRMGRENIRAIASELWQLAYKARENQVKIENS